MDARRDRTFLIDLGNGALLRLPKNTTAIIRLAADGGVTIETAGDIAALVGLDTVTIGDTVSDPQDRRALPRVSVDEPTIQMVREGGIEDLKGTISSTNRLVRQISQIADEQSRELSRLTRNLNRTVSAIDSSVVDSTLSNIRTTTANLAQLSADFQDTRERMSTLLTKLESGDGSAAKLLNDPGLYNDVRALVQRVDSLTADFKKNPRKYINLEIF